MYNTNDNNNCYYFGEYDNLKDSKYRISRINSMLNDKKRELEELKYAVEIYEKERVRTVLNEVSYYWYNPSYREKINEWLKKEKTKYDKRKKNPEKEYFDFITEQISNYVFCKKPIKIINTMVGGYERYYDAIEFTCEDMQFQLNMPNLKSINSTNFEYANEGKIAIYVRSSSCSITQIASGYDENEICKQIEKFFEDEERIKEIKSKYSIKTA